MLACGYTSVALVTQLQPKADIYPSGRLPHISFVATFDVTPAIFMEAERDNDGLDWPLWFGVFIQEDPLSKVWPQDDAAFAIVHHHPALAFYTSLRYEFYSGECTQSSQRA